MSFNIYFPIFCIPWRISPYFVTTFSGRSIFFLDIRLESGYILDFIEYLFKYSQFFWNILFFPMRISPNIVLVPLGLLYFFYFRLESGYFLDFIEYFSKYSIFPLENLSIFCSYLTYIWNIFFDILENLGIFEKMKISCV